MNSAFLGVVAGLVLIFAIVSSMTTAVTEAISRFIGLRAEYLLRGIRTLLVSKNTFHLKPFTGHTGPNVETVKDQRDPQSTEGFSQAVADLLAHPLIAANGPKDPNNAGNAHLSRPERRALPSYISAGAFSRALLESVLPNASKTTTLDDLITAIIANTKLDDRAKKLLVTLAQQADGDIDRLRTSLERAYDDHMQRVSGWYKRHVRWISLGVGAAIVLIFNLNTVRVASALYLDDPLRTAVTAQAQRPNECDPTQPNDCLTNVRAAVEPLSAAGLPLGWKAVPQCTAGTSCSWFARYGLTDPVRHDFGHNLLHVLAALLGYLVMILAVLPGSRFWFSALGRLNVFRSSGPTPATSTQATSTQAT